MPTQTSIAKITRPALADIYTRRRLLRLLDAGRKRSVTWVSGPAGSGKTTLVASWIEGRKLPCLWYQIDEGDADIATFFYYLGLAGKKAAPRHRKPLPLLTPEYLPGAPTFSRRYFENLCSRLHTPFILVFDNYQEIPAASPFHEILHAGLSSLPHGVHVVVISTEEPPAAFTRMLAGNSVNVVGRDDLQLTPEESKGISRLLNKAPQHKDLISLMHERTDGWAAGLILFIKALGREVVEPQTLFAMTREKIFAYFANELFEKIEGETQDFLLKTSVLPKITPSIAEQLTGNRNAAWILSELNRRNYFTARRKLEGDTYEYHPLFREFLTERARQAYSQTEFHAIQKQAAVLLMKSEQVEDAAELFLQAGAWEELSRLVMDHAQSFIMQGRNKTVEKWVSSIPEEIVSGSAWLLYWLGICKLPVAPDESHTSLKKAIMLFQTDGDTTGVLLAWSSLVEIIIYGLDTITELDEWMEFLDHYLKRTKKPIPSQLENRTACAMILAMVMRRPGHPDFDQWVKRAHSHEAPHQQLTLLLALTYYWTYKGKPLKMEATVNAMRRISEARDISPLEQTTLKLAEVMWFIFSGRAESSVRSCFEGLQVGENTGVHLLDFVLMGNAIVSAYNSNRSDLVIGYIEKMGAAPEKLRKNDRSFYHFLAAIRSFMDKDLPKANYHIQIALELALQAGFVMSEIVTRFVYIQVLTDLGKHRDADEHFKKILEFDSALNSHTAQFGIMLIQSLKAFRVNQEKDGLEFLRQGFTIARQNQLFSTYFAWRSSDIAELCSIALQHGIEVEYVQEFIRRKNVVPEEPPLHIENWPWQVKIFALGNFKLLVDDKPVKFSRKAPKKPLELLRVIVALGGRDLSEQRLMDALWPDTEGDGGRKSLSVTVSRLRELLGVKDALLWNEGMISLNDRVVWTDVWAFERMLESQEFQVRSSEIKGIKDKSTIRNSKSEIDNLQKALDFYRGHFLEGETNSWAISPRERLRESFLYAIEALGAHWERKQEWQRAIEVYRRGVHADDLFEKCYIRMMSCLLKLGSQAEALSVYRRFKKTLHGYGVEPSTEAEELHRQIISNGEGQ